MRFLTILALITLTLTAQAGERDLRSSIKGIKLGNSHILSFHQNGRPAVIRGKAPQKPNDYQDLKKLGVTDVVIFKNETKNEVGQEIQALQRMGFSQQQILAIPFPYKNMPAFQNSCQMIVDALGRVLEIEKRGGTVYFHCTMGQDRTGLLAGLYQIVKDREREMHEVFFGEMCARGYEAGAGPGKPMETVVLPIRRELTPLYVALAKKIAAFGYRPDLCQTPFIDAVPGEAESLTCGR